MTREFVILSEVALDIDLLADVAREVLVDGVGMSYRDGEITQFITAEGLPAVTVFNSEAVLIPQEAAATLVDPPASFGLWTDVTIAHGAAPIARTLLDAFAARVGGVVKEKR